MNEAEILARAAEMLLLRLLRDGWSLEAAQNGGNRTLTIDGFRFGIFRGNLDELMRMFEFYGAWNEIHGRSYFINDQANPDAGETKT